MRDPTQGCQSQDRRGRDLDEEQDAAETARMVEEQGRACFRLAGDIGDPEFCAAAVERTVEELGGSTSW